MLTLIVSLRRPGKGRPTGPEHVCYAAERVNVRSTRRAFKLPLFRRSVGIAETLLERVRGGRIGDETSNSEIGDLPAPFVSKHVARLQVTVHDALDLDQP